MPPVKKFVLPPKPVKGVTAPAKPAAPKQDPKDLGKKTAVEFTIKFSDGSYLQASGELADVIFRYQAECERVALSTQMVNFLAPTLTLFNQDGTVLAAGKRG